MNSYSALPTGTGDSSDADSVQSDSPPPAAAPKRATLGAWALAACIACTVLNVATALLAPSAASVRPARPFSSYTPAEVRLLRRPSQYIGLENVVRPPAAAAAPRLAFTNHPIVMLPVDAADPRAVFDAAPAKHTTTIGTVTPEVHRFLVTDTASTVVQFRAIDFGMEDCELSVRLPPAGPGEEGLSALAIYRLNTTHALDAAALSHATRPPRLPKLADIPLHPTEDVHWHRSFACPSESVLTFELACSVSVGHSCHVEWWQNARAEVFDAGVYVTQHSTV